MVRPGPNDAQRNRSAVRTQSGSISTRSTDVGSTDGRALLATSILDCRDTAKNPTPKSIYIHPNRTRKLRALGLNERIVFVETLLMALIPCPFHEANLIDSIPGLCRERKELRKVAVLRREMRFTEMSPTKPYPPRKRLQASCHWSM